MHRSIDTYYFKFYNDKKHKGEKIMYYTLKIVSIQCTTKDRAITTYGTIVNGTIIKAISNPCGIIYSCMSQDQLITTIAKIDWSKNRIHEINSYNTKVIFGINEVDENNQLKKC